MTTSSHSRVPYPSSNPLQLTEDLSCLIISLGFTLSQAEKLEEWGFTEPDDLLCMTEVECIERLGLGQLQLVRMRRLRSRAQQREFQLPSGLINSLPKFRSASPDAFTDADGLITRFEGLMTSVGIGPEHWARTLTLCLTKAEDTSFWTHHLKSNSHFLWPEHREIFGRHFGVFEQKARSLAALHAISQKPNETVQSYLDRAEDLMRRAGLDITTTTLPYPVRQGLKSKEIKRFLLFKEDMDSPYTFKSFSDWCLLADDRITGSSLFDGPSPVAKQVKICGYCKKAGHLKEECRRRKREITESTPKTTEKCKTCGSSAHRFLDCPNNICNNCKTKGHTVLSCPSITCKDCGQKGHPSSRSPSCLKYNKEKKRPYKEGASPEPYNVFSIRTNEYKHQVYIPILVGGARLMALVDTGSSISLIDGSTAEELDIVLEDESSTATSIFTGSSPVSLRKTRPIHVEWSEGSMECSFFVTGLQEKVLLGWEELKRMGISLSNLPYDFPNPKSMDLTNPDSFEREPRPRTDLLRIPNGELDELMTAIGPLLEANAAIADNNICSHPDAVLKIDVGTANPVFRPQYGVPERLKHVIDKQVTEWLETERIEVASPANRWNSSLLLAPKRDLYGRLQDWRVCFDARSINKFLTPDTYEIPKIKQLFQRVVGFLYCSSIDLAAAFQQIRIREEDKHITSFIWGATRYQYRTAPFGLSIIPGFFQRLMTTVLQAHLKYTLIYIDDIFIFSNSLHEHIHHCTSVIKTLTKFVLKMRPTKCHFGYKEASLLGHILDGSSIRPDPMKVQTFASLPKPKTAKQVQALLGLSTYLRDYIPRYSEVAHHLEVVKNTTDLASVWGREQDIAFETMKSMLINSAILSNPDYNLPFLVATDASQFGVGGVLYQQVDSTTKYIAFFSKALSPSQRNYSATKRELLGIILSLRAFKNYIYGQQFDLYTDHKALVHLFTDKDRSYMLNAWLEEIIEFDFRVHHRPGMLMQLPDALSRIHREFNLKIRGDELASFDEPRFNIGRVILLCDVCHKRASALCDTKRCRNHCLGCHIHPMAGVSSFTENPDVEVIPLISMDESTPETALSDLNCFIRDVVKKQDPGADSSRMDEVRKAHEFNHAGASGLFKYLFRAGYFWKSMKTMCEQVSGSCIRCLQFNIQRKGFHPLRAISAQLPFDHISVDLGTFNTTSREGSNFFLVIVDICTRFCILRALKTKSAQEVARELYKVMCDFGLFKVIQSDNGREFVNSVMTELKSHCGFQHRTVAAYNPKANGSAEHMVKQVKLLLDKHMLGDIHNWCLYLPAAQLALNTRISKRHHSTPFSLMFTRAHNLFTDYSDVEQRLLTEEEIFERNQTLTKLLFPSLTTATTAYNNKMIEDFALKNKIVDKLPAGAFVMKLIDDRRDKTMPSYEGPFKVLSCTAHNTYVLLDTTGQLYPRNVPMSQLKLISVPDEFFRDPSYEVESIVKHRGPVSAREYLVRWKGFSPSEDTWEPADKFDDPQIISTYWKTISAAKRSRLK